ncbi:MAG: nucleotidyltransferase family protein [Alphaproteobacteria bacterium]
MAETADATRDLLDAIKTPRVVEEFGLGRWDLLIRQARRTRLLSRIAVRTADLGLTGSLPPGVGDTLTAARNVASDNRRMITWEINRIRRALADVDTPVILLKGAAYAAADLPPARGRIAGDIDIMVPAARLEEVEATLQRHGWCSITFSDYDQRYYRRWMHELPPLRHAERETVIDVHHTILPRTSRLRPDPDKLWHATRAVADTGMQMLGPQDMVLHSAAHLFQDGDLNFALRDLVDIVDLLGCFGAEPEFWDGLFERSEVHQLQRPLFYALRYGAMLLDLSVPADVERKIAAAAPRNLALELMDRTVPKALLPDHPDRPSGIRGRAAMLLYLRSHWLRMPPLLLAAHLAHKSVIQVSMAYLRWRRDKAAA